MQLRPCHFRDIVFDSTFKNSPARNVITGRELDPVHPHGASASTIDVISKELGSTETLLPATPSQDLWHEGRNPGGAVTTNYMTSSLAVLWHT